MSFVTHKKREILDITGDIQKRLLAQSAGDGICFLNVLHTTAAITTADLDPGTDLDMLDAWDAMVPHLHYRHPHNPAHMPDHILSALIGTSLTVPYSQRRLMLGTWQRIILVELDGPRTRQVATNYLPLSGR